MCTFRSIKLSTENAEITLAFINRGRSEPARRALGPWLLPGCKSGQPRARRSPRCTAHLGAARPLHQPVPLRAFARRSLPRPRAAFRPTSSGAYLMAMLIFPRNLGGILMWLAGRGRAAWRRTYPLRSSIGRIATPGQVGTSWQLPPRSRRLHFYLLLNALW